MKVEKKEKTFSWLKFSLKILGLLVAIFVTVIFTDLKGYFVADQSNNHIRRKWAYFYEYSKTKNVDVVILGNSHVITGVDPFVLSGALGSTCFILGNSGTGIIDAWFQLGEALQHCTPKLIVLETYCIGNTEKPQGEAIPYLQSFDAQRNIKYKLKCMPQLFYSDSWVEAWSTSIRNHSFLLTDKARIQYNIKNPKEPKMRKMDLGRFARFSFGLQDSILQKYDSIGAPVKGEERLISDFSKTYLGKIMKMCEKKYSCFISYNTNVLQTYYTLCLGGTISFEQIICIGAIKLLPFIDNLNVTFITSDKFSFLSIFKIKRLLSLFSCNANSFTCIFPISLSFTIDEKLDIPFTTY